MADRAVILLSGGLDSTTTLAVARAEGYECYALSFDYGQRHAIELACRDRLFDGIKDLHADWTSRLGESHTLSIPTLAAAAMTSQLAW